MATVKPQEPVHAALGVGGATVPAFRL